VMIVLRMTVNIYLAHHQHASPEAPGSQDSLQSLPESLQEIRSKFEALKSQYSHFVKAMQTSIQDGNQRSSPLPYTPEEESRRDQVNQYSSTRSSFRDSMATTASGSQAEWFDAEDIGPQEFVMDISHDISEPGSRILGPDELDESSLENDDSSINTDLGELERVTSPTPEPVPAQLGVVQVSRRTQLPCLPPSDEGSLFTILKKNVGKVSLRVC